jgi:signal transduction histidine kinase
VSNLRERVSEPPPPVNLAADAAGVLPVRRAWLGGLWAALVVLLWASGLSADPLAALLFLVPILAGYALSALDGLVVFALSSVAHLALRLIGADGEARGLELLLAPSSWGPLATFALFAATGEAHARTVEERKQRVAEAEEARRAAERRAGEEKRLARSLATLASGLHSAFEPDRMLVRFLTLLRTLLGAEAAVTLAADESRSAFTVLESSSDDSRPPGDLPETEFALAEVSRDAVSSISFLAGDAGLLGRVMRESFGVSAGYAAPILRGPRLAGLLLVAFRDGERPLTDPERSLLAGGAALCATLFESARLHRELRQSTRVKSEFISTVSHELRTPLNSIIGYCDLVRDGTVGAINEQQKHALDRLHAYSVQFAELIASVLEVNRIEGGYLEVNWTECDLDAFFEALRSSIPSHWEKEDVELRFVGRAGRPIRTDPEKLRLMLRHLVQNALKFTRSGSVSVEMAVTPGTLHFTVRDTGIGMRPEIRQSLFTMFQPGDVTDRRTHGGLGLGLYLVDRMVRALWGQISIDSTPGKGTTVRVILPVEEPIDSPAVRG